MAGIPCLVVGAGGHARVVIDILRSEGRYDPVAATDTSPGKRGKDVDGVPIIGDDRCARRLGKVRSFVLGLGLGARTRPRMELFDRMTAMGLEPLTAVHPRAIVHDRSKIGAGTVVMAGGVVNPGARIGRNVILNTGSLVEHDCRVGDHAHLAPRATLCGGVRLGEGAFVGAHACVLEGLVVGPWSTVGAGAVVLARVSRETTVVGVPARAMGKDHP